MRIASKNAGLGLMETLISMVILSGVTVATMAVMNKLSRKQSESNLMSQYTLVAQQLDSGFDYDFTNAIKLDGAYSGKANGTYTNDGSQFDNVQTFGIVRNPNAAFSTSMSDGMQLFVADSGLSSDSIFDISSATSYAGGAAEFTVSGDFTPTIALSEDLIVITVSGAKELFKVASVTTANGSGSTVISTVRVTKCVSGLLTEIQSAIGSSNVPQMYRVQRVIYSVGTANNSRGLYRTVNGSSTLLAADVVSMQINYQLSTARSACASKNNSRWFANPTGTDWSTSCTWNDVVAVHMELVLESEKDLGATANFNPHSVATTPVPDGKVRYIVHLSKSPKNYSTSS